MVLFRDGGVYLGLLGVMHYPSAKSREGVRQHIELAWSPDSYNWHRIAEGTPLIANTPRAEKKYGTMPYDWGAMFPSQPVFRDDGIRIYYGASDWYFFDWRKSGLALATLRKDGWAGYQPVDRSRPAVVTTTSLSRQPGNLRLTADIEPGGSIRVALLDGNHNELATSAPITRTVTDHEVRWPAGTPLEKIENATLRFRFELLHAKLYSFAF